MLGIEVVLDSVLMWRDWMSSARVEVVLDCVLMRREGLGELYARVEVVPDCLNRGGGIW